MSDPLSHAPAAIVAALTRLKEDLIRSAGKNLAGLILYGGLARGRYRPGKSDINVVVLLNEVSAPALAAKKDKHMHEATLTIVDEDRLEVNGIGWENGAPAKEMCCGLKLVRKK